MESIKEGKGNSKSVWRTLRHLIPKCKEHGIQGLEINGSLVTELEDITNHFNCFFTNIGEVLAGSIPDTARCAIDHLQSYIPQVSSSFSFRCVSTDEVLKLLKSLPEDKATGLDDLPAKLLKMTADTIAPSLTKIINRSLKTGQFPSA